eukprot:RCo037805
MASRCSSCARRFRMLWRHRYECSCCGQALCFACLGQHRCSPRAQAEAQAEVEMDYVLVGTDHDASGDGGHAGGAMANENRLKVALLPAEPVSMPTTNERVSQWLCEVPVAGLPLSGVAETEHYQPQTVTVAPSTPSTKPPDHGTSKKQQRWQQYYRDLGCPLGQGSYGRVLLVAREAEDFALKLTGELFEKDRYRNLKTHRTYRELWLAGHLSHRNVVRAVDAFYDAAQCELALVFPLKDYSLDRFMRTPYFHAADIPILMADCLRGLHYLHTFNIVHRDLKPANLLVSLPRNGQAGPPILQVADLGLARGELEQPDLTPLVVTLNYRAPELLMLTCRQYSFEIDIWSFGCIFVECLTGRPLFTLRSLETHRHSLRKVEAWLASPVAARVQLLGRAPEVLQVVQRSLLRDPKQRASAGELLELPYFACVSEPLTTTSSSSSSCCCCSAQPPLLPT